MSWLLLELEGVLSVVRACKTLHTETVLLADGAHVVLPLYWVGVTVVTRGSRVGVPSEGGLLQVIRHDHLEGPKLSSAHRTKDLGALGKLVISPDLHTLAVDAVSTAVPTEGEVLSWGHLILTDRTTVSLFHGARLHTILIILYSGLV